MHTIHLDAIRRFEGFTARATPDYAQLSNGYGTRARFAGEVIDKAEAERRFRTEVADARQIVERFAPTADEGTKAALTSLTFNAGTAWTRAGLGQAVARGDLETARTLFLQYDKAGGQTLPGLTARRAVEAQWIGQQIATEPVTSPAIPSQSVATTGNGAAAVTAAALATATEAARTTPASLATANASAPARHTANATIPNPTTATRAPLPPSLSSGTTSLGSLSLDALRARWQAERAALLAHTAQSTSRAAPAQPSAMTTLALQALAQQAQAPTSAEARPKADTTSA